MIVMVRSVLLICVVLSAISISIVESGGGCTNGLTCRYCGCDAMYGPGYTCRTSTDHTCCWGNNYYDPATPVCGNNLNECENCDDGNLVNGDGCSSTCDVEPGWSCAFSGQRSACTPICTNGCGANGVCTAPNVCTCSAGYTGSTCQYAYTTGATTCGSGLYCGWCGCDAMYGPGWTCRTSSDRSCCWGNNYYTAIAPRAYCGNNVTECEPCDDGNIISGDGCSSTCSVEPGYTCVITLDQTSVCTKNPTPAPTAAPTKAPTVPPTAPPTAPPTIPPTAPPTKSPTIPPTAPPTAPPTIPPTAPPTAPPTIPPTAPPTIPPTAAPTCPPGLFGPTCSYTAGQSVCGSGLFCGWCGCDAMYGPGWTCRTGSDRSCCWGNNYYTPIAPSAYCGNNVTECEPCDDGNIANGDGCSSTCGVEPGYTCVITLDQRSFCTKNPTPAPTIPPTSPPTTPPTLAPTSPPSKPPTVSPTRIPDEAWWNPNAWYVIPDGTPKGSLCSSTSTDTTKWCLLPFNGALSQYIELPSFQIPTTGYTVDIKFVANSNNGWSRLFEVGVGPDNENVLFSFLGGGNQIIYQDYIAGAAVSSPTVTYTYGTVTGISLSQAVNTSFFLGLDETYYFGTSIPYPTTNVVRGQRYVGRSLYAGDSYFFGKFGEIRLWNKFRAFPDFISSRKVHLDPYAGPYDGLIALYQVDKICGNWLIDLTGNNNHAILQNFAATNLFASCYGHGVCNTSSHQCTCNPGYTGYACEKYL